MEIQKKHITQTEQKIESMSALVLILKNESFLYYIWQEAAHVEFEASSLEQI
jgi:hypothetical protein